MIETLWLSLVHCSKYCEHLRTKSLALVVTHIYVSFTGLITYIKPPPWCLSSLQTIQSLFVNGQCALEWSTSLPRQLTSSLYPPGFTTVLPSVCSPSASGARPQSGHTAIISQGESEEQKGWSNIQWLECEWEGKAETKNGSGQLYLKRKKGKNYEHVQKMTLFMLPQACHRQIKALFLSSLYSKKHILRLHWPLTQRKWHNVQIYNISILLIDLQQY